MEVLGVSLGTQKFRKKNWEGVMKRVSARLSKWKWMLPQLSYQGIILVVNNLVALALWHRLIVLSSPQSLIEEI